MLAMATTEGKTNGIPYSGYIVNMKWLFVVFEKSIIEFITPIPCKRRLYLYIYISRVKMIGRSMKHAH